MGWRGLRGNQTVVDLAREHPNEYVYFAMKFPICRRRGPRLKNISSWRARHRRTKISCRGGFAEMEIIYKIAGNIGCGADAFST